MAGFIEGYDKNLQAIGEQLNGSTSIFINTGINIVALGMLLMVARRVYRVWGMNEPLDIYGMLRPIGFALLLKFYMVFMGAVDATLEVVNETVVGYVNGGKSSMITALVELDEDNSKSMDEKTAGKDLGKTPIEESPSNGFWDSITGGAEWIGAKFLAAIQYAIRWLAFILLIFGYVFLSTIRLLYLLILKLIGPIAIAFSAFEIFSDSWKGWLSNYINVSLWLPIANTFMFILLKLSNSMVDKTNMDEIQINMALIILYITGVFGFFKVPDLANLIISGGAGAIGSNAMGVSASPVSAVAAYMGSKAGSAGKAGVEMLKNTFGGNQSASNNNGRVTEQANQPLK
jgi:TrbL/VirB6 plasmid conjugal transfer protein